MLHSYEEEDRVSLTEGLYTIYTYTMLYYTTIFTLCLDVGQMDTWKLEINFDVVWT